MAYTNFLHLTLHFYFKHFIHFKYTFDNGHKHRMVDRFHKYRKGHKRTFPFKKLKNSKKRRKNSYYNCIKMTQFFINFSFRRYVFRTPNTHQKLQMETKSEFTSNVTFNNSHIHINFVFLKSTALKSENMTSENGKGLRCYDTTSLNLQLLNLGQLLVFAYKLPLWIPYVKLNVVDNSLDSVCIFFLTFTI